MFTMVQFQAIADAIASGATSVSYDGKRVEYGSLDNLLRVRDIIGRSLGIIPNTSATMFAAHDRGYPAPQYGVQGTLISGF